MKQIGYVSVLAPAQERNLDVGAKAAGDIGRALRAEELAEGPLRGPDAVERRKRGPGARAVEARDLDGHELETRSRHERSLELGGAAIEGHFVAAVAKLLRERKRRIDMASRTARRNRDPELVCHRYPLLLGLFEPPEAPPLLRTLGPLSSERRRERASPWRLILWRGPAALPAPPSTTVKAPPDEGLP